MLNGLDEIVWKDLSHAYGSAQDTPDLLRRAASEDGATAAKAISDLHGSLFHQGTVYPATVAAVPFLAEFAAHAPRRRHEFALMLGMLADDHHAYGDEFADVRSAVAAQSGLLAGLLDDPEPSVRAAAAYATATAGVTPDVLWRRWPVENDPAVRASLALALAETSPAAARQPLEESAVRGEPRVRVASAVALLRAGFDWPAGTVPALVSAIDIGASIAHPWVRGPEWPVEVAVSASTPLARALIEHMLRSDAARTRTAGLWALSARCDALRSAPPIFVPLITPLLDDPDPAVHEAAMNVLRRAGAAAAQFANAVAAVAARFPETAGNRGFTVEYRAVETLHRLGDPRWVSPVCEAATRGHQPRFSSGAVRFTPAVLNAIQARLKTDPATAETLAGSVSHWGANAEPLLPDLLAAFDHAGPRIAETLLALGHDDPRAVRHWEANARTGDLRAALAVLRLTGNPQAVLDALHTILAGDGRSPSTHPSDIDRLGDALKPMLPVATALLTGTADPVHPRSRPCQSADRGHRMVHRRRRGGVTPGRVAPGGFGTEVLARDVVAAAVAIRERRPTGRFLRYPPGCLQERPGAGRRVDRVHAAHRDLNSVQVLVADG
ncbi:HEAT repeat domain-containing protein [Actinoplanes solisilvae]|uniref:HEAT repeat domain-containing protein n=1 Tax=Actinoplanes solisilvae TaxID=2486853 RepID=UPI000FD94208|nr:hypothetical protein [Actinoplanes solisilvae]